MRSRWACGRPWTAALLAPPLVGAALLAAVAAGCGPDPGDGPAQVAAVDPAVEPGAGLTAACLGDGGAPVRFTDITAAAGIDFVHHNGASDQRLLPETMGSGVAVFDADGDGWPDLLFLDSRPLAAAESGDGGAGSAGGARLYRNLGRADQRSLRFAEVTGDGGGPFPAPFIRPFFAMGVAVGDVDNDGDPDLYLTAVGRDRLLINESGGAGDGAGGLRFTEAPLPVDDDGFGSSAAFLDSDRDGRLDLFAGRYVSWSPERDMACSPDGVHRTYCTPEGYAGQSNRLLRNRGGGRFADVTAAAGLLAPEGKTLGVAPLDVNGDGWPDLAVANDTVRNYLFVNQGDGSYREAAVERGLAFSQSGATRGAMGIDAADLDGDGRQEVVIGNFSHEMAALYAPTEAGLYRDEAAQRGIGLPTLMRLAFGTLASDLNRDGHLDILFANGHIEPEIARFQSIQQYAQPPSVFVNCGDGSFEELAGPLVGRELVGRGLAAGDLDGDGDEELIVTQNGRPAVVLRNDAAPTPWLRLHLTAATGNVTPYGASVTVEVEQGGERRQLTRRLSSGRSYLSASEPALTVPLAAGARVGSVEIAWPSGKRVRLRRPRVGRVLRWVE